MKKFGLAMTAFSALALLGGCGGGATGDYDADTYTSDGKLIINFFGQDIDSLQSPTEATKMVVKIIEDKFNVKFEFSSASPEGYLTVLNTNIGSGEVPDIWFHEVNQPLYSKCLNDEYMMDFEPYLNTYPNIKAAFERYDLNQMKSYLGDGLYGFPLVLDDKYSEDLTNVHAMYYRRDWYTNLAAKNYKPVSGLNLVDPEDPSFNYLNFYDLMEGFTIGDPDNNGKDDTYGLILTNDGGTYWWYPFMCMFDINNQDWSFNKETERLEPNVINEKTKAALDYLSNMYDKGYINSDYATTTTLTRMKNEFLNGEGGCFVYNAQFEHATGILNMMQPFLYNDQNVKTKEMKDVVRGMPVVTNINGEKKLWGHTNKFGYRSINNYCSPNKKEKILEIMNWMLSEEGLTLLDHGVEGVHYHKDSSGNIVSDLPVNQTTGEKYTFFDNTVARGVYFLKGLVSWSTPIPTENKYHDEAIQITSAWNHDYLVGNKTAYCAVDPNYALTCKNLDDITTIAFQKIVSKLDGNENSKKEQRTKLWDSFVSDYIKKGNGYINAINRKAEEIGVI